MVIKAYLIVCRFYNNAESALPYRWDDAVPKRGLLDLKELMSFNGSLCDSEPDDHHYKLNKYFWRF